MPIWHRKLSEHIDRRVNNPVVAALVRRWQEARPAAAELPALAAFELESMADWSPCLMLLQHEGEDFRYAHYGREIARHSGFEMKGRLLSSFGGEIGAFFIDCCHDCRLRGEPLYTVHYADRAFNVFTWERLLLPLRDDEGRLWLLGYVQPLQSRQDLLQQVLDSSDEAILALRPERDEAGRNVGWRVLLINHAMAELVGQAAPVASGQLASDVLLRWDDLGLEQACRAVAAGEARASADVPLTLVTAGRQRRLRVSLARLDDGCVLRLSDAGESPAALARHDVLAAQARSRRWLTLIDDELGAAQAELPPSPRLARLQRTLLQLRQFDARSTDGAEASAIGPALRDWLADLRDALRDVLPDARVGLLVEAVPPLPAGGLADAARWQALAFDCAAWLLERAEIVAGTAGELHLRLRLAGQHPQLELICNRNVPRSAIELEPLRLRAEQLGGALDADAAWPGALALRLPWPGLATADEPALEHRTPDGDEALRPHRARPRVLVAEDDAVNQLVLRRQLELLGCLVELAGDGEQALQRWQQAHDEAGRDGLPAQRFALVLTDLWMPHLDGIGLAAALRRREAEQLRPRVPLLAVTAQPSDSEARQLLDAGVDGVLRKPVQLAELRQALERWLPSRALPTAAASVGENRPALDLEVLRRLLDHDEAAVRELLEEFRRSAQTLAHEMRRAYRSGDASQLAAIAHKLKSAAQAVGAQHLAALCSQLEHREAATDPALVSAGLDAFDRAMSEVTSGIADHLGPNAAPAR